MGSLLGGCVVLALGALSAPVCATEGTPPESPMPDPAPDVETHVAALPNVGFDTDDGLGFGARVEVTRVGDGYAPYLAAYVAQAYATVRGYHHHRVRLDFPYVADGKHRLAIHVAYRQWLNDGYWGLGNGTTLDGPATDRLDQGLVSKYNRYTLIQPYTRATLRTRLGGPWSVFEAVDLKYSEVRTYAGSLLEAERPFGMAGGASAQLYVGGLFDTREPEVTPRSGVLLELSVRGGLGEHGVRYVGPTFSLRDYLGLGPRVVLAWRVMGEHLFGQVPFYDMVQWGGLQPVSGFGSSETVRGLPFGRFHAPGKAVLNTELRVDVLEHRLSKRSMSWEIVPFMDTGVVYQPGEPYAPGLPVLHPGAGGGVRAIFDETMVGRLDVGWGRDVVGAGAAGVAADTRWTLGIYLVFDHTF